MPGAGTTRTLVVIRHAKSDWAIPASDRDRPLASRGVRQAPPSGRWLATHLPPLDLAVVSPARRARDTWDLVAAELSARPPTTVSETAYTFDGDDLVRLIAGFGADVTRAALVGHNPAVEELIEALTGEWVRMPTSALAVVDLPSWQAVGSGRMRYAGRPATEAST